MMIPRLITAALAPLLLGACATVPADSPRPAVFENGVVSAADPRAAEAGAQMLRQGGSAADAAIATMVALTVVEPQSSGIGGGGFYLHHAPDGTVTTLDGRETAPSGAGPDWFLDASGKPLSRREAVESGLSIGVPGNIALAAEAHRRHGKLPWAELFAPAINLAQGGWMVSERLREFLVRSKSTASRDPASRALFFGADGEPVPVGTVVRNPQLAATLERIAKDGPQAFYGTLAAQALASRVQEDTPRPGGMTAQDIASYRAKDRPPVCGTYRLHRICGMGPPSSGATTVLAILGQLEAFDMGTLGPDSPVAWHLFAESQRLAYADRERFLADSDFVTVPVGALIDPAYLRARGALIRADAAMERAEPGLPLAPPGGAQPPEQGTSHFSVIDRAGSAVSYTSTIEGPFGSGLMFGGFHLNNELTDFSMVPLVDGRAVVNRIEGGKRPRSSMAPTLVYGPDGRLMLVVGAAGGATIPVQVARVLIGMIDWDLPVDRALALPVIFAPGDSPTVEEGSTLEAMIPALRSFGHKDIRVRQLPLKANAVAIVGGRTAGAADPRSEGVAIPE